MYILNILTNNAQGYGQKGGKMDGREPGENGQMAGMDANGNFNKEQTETNLTNQASVFAAQRAKYGPEDGFNKLTDEQNAKDYADLLDLPASDKYKDRIKDALDEYDTMSPAAKEMIDKYRNTKQ